MQSAFGSEGRFFVPLNPVARIFKETANDSPSLYARSRAVEGHRSPRREVLADDSRTARSILTSPQGLLGQAIDCVLKRWEALTRFVADDTRSKLVRH
jgi:hypothetical protein